MSRETHISAIVEHLLKLQRPVMHAGWKDLGFSHAQVSLLFLLSRHEKKSVKEIADFMGISKSAVTQLADPLADKGCVIRVSDDKDRRIVRLSLSPDGRKTLKKIARMKLDGFRTAMDSLSDKEVERLHAIVIKMSK